MTDELRYMMEIEISDGADVDSLEKLLEQLLLDLYETGDVISIKVIDKGDIKDDGFEEITSVLDALDNDRITKAIDTVKKLEEEDTEYDAE